MLISIFFCLNIVIKVVYKYVIYFNLLYNLFMIKKGNLNEFTEKLLNYLRNEINDNMM